MAVLRKYERNKLTQKMLDLEMVDYKLKISHKKRSVGRLRYFNPGYTNNKLN